MIYVGKGILEFELPEENNEFLIATKALDARILVHDIRNIIRDHLKYGKELTMQGLYEFVCSEEADLPLLE